MRNEAFIIGHMYSVEQIRNELGGPLLASIATKNGKVIYAKFKFHKILNPNLPQEIWIPNGPIQYKNALNWAKSEVQIPLFINMKRGKKFWQYIGKVFVEIVFEKEKAQRYTGQDISLVLKIV